MVKNTAPVNYAIRFSAPVTALTARRVPALPESRLLRNFSLPSTPHIMASKFMANAAFEARLLLRPSHQRTVWTVSKLKCPVPGRPTLPPILSSRSYSDSTSTPTPPLPESSGSTSTSPFPKSSGSTEGSRSSGPEDKNRSHSETWGKVWGWAKARASAWGLGTIGGVRAGSFFVPFETC
jgi:hypothetical protein